jgi:multidrug resistance protein
MMTRRVLGVVCAALFVDSLLYSVAVPVLPGYSQSLDTSVFQMGLLFGSYAIGLLLASPVAGVVSDRIGRRIPLLVGSFGIAAATALFVVGDSYWLLMGARTLQGAAAAVVWTAGAALVADVFPPERLGAAMSALLASMSLGLIMGPPLGGVLAEWFGRPAPFLITAAVAVGTGLVQLLVIPPAAAQRPRPSRFTRLFAYRPAFVAIGGIALAATALTFLEPTLPLDMAVRLGVGEAATGIAFGIAALVHAATAVGIGNIAARWRYQVMAGTGLLALGGLVPLLVLAHSVTAVTLVLAAFSVALTFVLVPALPELARVVDRIGAGNGGAYALFNAAYAVGMLVGPLAGGAGLAAAPTSVVYAVAGGVIAVGGLAVLTVRGNHA